MMARALNQRIEIVKKKLEFEWKNIFRQLNANDRDNSGVVSKREFESAVHQNGVFVSREEYGMLY